MLKVKYIASVASVAFSCTAYYGAAMAQAIPPAPAGQAQAGDPSQNGVPAQTGTAAADATQLHEIVVTARKTTENLQKAPASIVAVSGAEIQQKGLTDIQSLQSVLPSVDLEQQGPVTQTFIRGVGTRNDLPNYASSSAIVFNGIVLARYGTGGLFFDLGSVQSIAGPQGTLYGGSAAGGAIDIFSAQPRNDYSGSLLLEGGDYGTAHVGVDQNVPLGDKVSIRGSFDYDRHDGYFNDGIDALDRKESRLSVLLKPTSNLTALIFYNDDIDEGKPFTTASSKPFAFNSDPYRLPTVAPNGNAFDAQYTNQDNQNRIVGANVDWHVGGNTFTWIPGFSRTDANYNYFSNNTGSKLYVYDLEDQHSEELRWNRAIGALKLSSGFFYLHDDIDFQDFTGKANASELFNLTQLNRTRQVNTSYALFGQAVYALTDRLRFTAGVRGSIDDIDAAGQGAGGVPFTFRKSQVQPDGKVGVDYDLTPRVLLYANFQTGYIPFGYNPDVKPAPIVPTSRLLAESGGLKSRFFNNRLEFNTEFFYYDYSNFQAIAFVNQTGLSTVLNAKTSTIYGGDTTVRALLPLESEFDAGILIQSAHYTNFSGVGYNYTGNQLIDAPFATVNAGLQHNIHLGFADLLARVDTHYNSGYYSNFNNFPHTHQPAYTDTNFTLTYTPPDAIWRVQAYVENIEDVAVFNTLSAGSTPAAVATGSLQPPRTFGGRILVSWK